MRASLSIHCDEFYLLRFTSILVTFFIIIACVAQAFPSRDGFKNCSKLFTHKKCQKIQKMYSFCSMLDQHSKYDYITYDNFVRSDH